MELFPIIPNEDRVIIMPTELADKTSAGLWIPETAKAAPRSGKVVAVGEGKACPHCGLPAPLKIKVGMTVTFPETAGSPAWIGDKQYLVIRATDIQLFDPNSIPS
jgi:chaperonin GroES